MYSDWVGRFLGGTAASREIGKELGKAQSAASRAENALDRMRDTTDRQALIIRTLLTICERKGVFSEQEFRDVMNEIDLSDGRLDGRFKDKPKPRECPECAKINGKRAVSCMYCGAILPEREVL